eukprot:c20523_g1_i3 orf=755-2323(+)
MASIQQMFRGNYVSTCVDFLISDQKQPQNYGFDAEEEVNDETTGREKKRRKECSVMERQVDGSESTDVKQVEETGDIPAKQHCSSGSDKGMEHFAALPSAVGRGVGMRMIGLGQGSLAPGIMGPGRPLMPLGIGSLAQGFGPFGGIAPHGRPQIHLQEMLAQEHLLRAHALQLAQETLASAIRSPLARPLGAGTFQPFLGFDVLRPKHFPRPPPDLILGPMGHFARGQRPNLAIGRAGMSGKAGAQAESTLNSGIGRQFVWPAASGPNELQSLKRGRGRGRGIRTGLWGDAEPFVPMRGGLGSAGNPRAMINVAATSNMRHLNPDEVIFYQTTLAASQTDRDPLHNGFDARWKIEKERMLRNGLPHFRMPENATVGGNFSDGSMELGKEFGKTGEGKPLRSQDSSRAGNLAARLGPPAQAKAATSVTADSTDLAAGSNVIKLLQPVRKSRILTVSGLPEDTPMSTVAEAFEKLGKITDFKKSSKGDTFTISYSNEIEAVTAKRNLHRSCLAGKQITVDYAHQ